MEPIICRAYLFSKLIRVWSTLGSEGQFWVPLHKLNSGPVHIGPCTEVIMFQYDTLGAVLVNVAEQEVTIRCMAGEQVELPSRSENM